MCLILFAWQLRRDYPLVLAANRDEFYHRPTTPAGFWPDHPEVLAGRDLERGGTWLGLTRTGKVAAVTNYREPRDRSPATASRGHLVRDFLLSPLAPTPYLAGVAGNREAFHGFNLLVGDLRELCSYSNRGGGLRSLPPGLYGLSNHLLDTPWPKVVAGKRELAGLLARDQVDPARLMTLLADRRPAADAELPDTGVGLELERALSPRFIVTPGYGTRAATVLTVPAEGEARFLERSFGPGGRMESERHFTVPLAPR